MEKEVLKERQKLKSWLKHGDLQKIAEACEVDRDTLYKWFAGSDNPALELVVQETVKLRKQQAEEAAKRIINS